MQLNDLVGIEITATEVLERAREKGALLSPTTILGSLIERELDVLISQALLPPMPGGEASETVMKEAPKNAAK